MATNDVVILDSILEQRKKQTANSLSEEDYFELFTFEQVLKDYGLSYDELLYGKIGGGGDGGIDGFFIFINGAFIDEEIDPGIFKKDPVIELFLIQSTRSDSFSETKVDRAISTIEDIFALDRDMSELARLYNSDLIDKVSIFREAYIGLATFHPKLRICYTYASKGNSDGVHPKVANKSQVLKSVIERHFSGSTVEVGFLGARELLSASRIEKSYTLQLKFLENYIPRGVNSYVVLSSLIDYYHFVADENKDLRRYLFESNVRAYQGNVEVNRDIQQSLASSDDLDFWWLNNGVTILASKASIIGKIMTLNDVQIVNGLQTTEIIYDYLREKEGKEDIEEKDKQRSVLIRIIVIDDTAARDRIIKATNFQTAIPIASLKATDILQRDIEDYFLSHGLFYDRRKNYYKNIGKSVEKIISIPYLAQAIMAMVLREPDNARARPSSLIKRDDDYRRVFDKDMDPDVYLFCARTMKQFDIFLRDELTKYSVQERDILRHLKFHLAMLLVIKLLGKKDYKPVDIPPLLKDDISFDIIRRSLGEIISLANTFAEEQEWSMERASKSRELVDYLIKEADPGVQGNKDEL